MCIVQVTALVTGLFTLEEMVLSPDLHDELAAQLVTRCKDLGAVDKVRQPAAAGAVIYKACSVFAYQQGASACRLCISHALLHDMRQPIQSLQCLVSNHAVCQLYSGCMCMCANHLPPARVQSCRGGNCAARIPHIWPCTLFTPCRHMALASNDYARGCRCACSKSRQRAPPPSSSVCPTPPLPQCNALVPPSRSPACSPLQHLFLMPRLRATCLTMSF